MTIPAEVKPDNIESLDAERLWQDGLRAIDEQYEEAEQSRQRWLRIGKGLLIGKVRCPHNTEFAKWIEGTGYHILSQIERQDSMWLAINEALVMPALSETRIGSPKYARLHIREKIKPVYVQCVDVLAYDPSGSNAEGDRDGVESRPEPPVLVEAAPKLDPKLKFLHMPRCEDVCLAFTNGHTRTTIGKITKRGARGAEDIWNLILTAIDHGFVKRAAADIGAPTMRLLFPDSPRAWWEKYHLTDKKDREYIRDVIMPAAIANREAILKQPKAIDTIIAEHVKANQIAVQKQEAQKKVVELVKALPSNEKQIIAYGKQMWPVVNATYDYDQVRAAVWTFQDLSRWFSQTLSGHNSPGSVAQIIRLSTKWLQEYLNRALPGESGSRVRKIYVLIGELSRALENNPSGECRFPPPPHIEGQW